MKYYLTKRKKKIFPFALAQMELEGVMLHKIIQIEIDGYCMI